jgi:hyperosmotically inducible protein
LTVLASGFSKRWNDGGTNMSSGFKFKARGSLLSVSLLSAAAIMLPGLAMYAMPLPGAPQQTAPDNTKNNKGDAQTGAVTADQQKQNPADRMLTKKIRASIVDDKTLSTYAHNIKIISQDGKVTLKGPVRTAKEKADVEGKAAAIAGDTNVVSEIEVAPKS